MYRNRLQLSVAKVIPEKPDILTGLPHYISGAISGDSIMKRISLSRNKFALVDDEDFDQLNRYKWYASKGTSTYYARRKTGKTSVCMHREILGLGRGDNGKNDTDHFNHNGLDNQRHNLRVCTRSQNNHNSKPRTGKYKGVHWHKTRKIWMAEIKSGGISNFLGYYKIEVEAAKAYDLAAKELYGEFAYTNF